MNTPLRWQANDSTTGVPLSGAKLYTYIAGTTNSKATYSDEALTTPNANPVVADSAGYFGSIYLSSGQPYKLVLKTSAGVTIWTQDNVYANQSTAATASLAARTMQMGSNPLDYGALGDGVADESDEVNAAVVNATDVVDLLGKTYRCDSAITLKSGVTLQNGTLDFSNNAGASCVAIAGALEANILATVNLNVGDTTITLAAVTSMSPGDYLVISDTAGTSKEVVQIDSIAALVVSIVGNVKHAWTVAGGAYVKRFNTTASKNVTLRNLKIIGDPASVVAQSIIDIDVASDITIDNCVVEGIPNNALAYGVTAVHAANITIRGSRIGSSDGSPMCVLTEAAVDVRISDCYMHDAGYGVYFYNTSEGQVVNSRINKMGNYGILSGSWCDGIIINGCRVTLSTSRAIQLSALGAVVANCIIDDSDIYLQPSAPTKTCRLVVSNNTVGGGIIVYGALSVNAYAIVTGNICTTLTISAAAYTLDNCVVSGNKCTAILATALESNVTITDNNATSISVVDTPSVVVKGNRVTGAVTNGGLIDVDANTVAFTSCVIADNALAPTNDHGIRVDGNVASTGLSITGNVIQHSGGANDCPVKITQHVQQIAITGNVLIRTDDNDDSIQLDGHGAGDISNVVVAGNTFVNGAFTVGEPTDANNTNVAYMGNVSSGVNAAGDVEGTCTIGTAAAADTHNLHT